MQAIPPNLGRRRACRTSCIVTTRTCVRHLPGNLLAAIHRILRAGAWKYALRTSTSATTFHPRYQCRPPTAPLSAPQAEASTRTTLALRESPRAHVGPVSTHPVLMGAFSVSRRHVSLGDSRVHLVATNVLHLPTSRLGAQVRVMPLAFVVIPMSTFPQAEQFLLVVVHEFPHFILYVVCSFVFMDNPAYPLCTLHFLLLFPASSNPACPLSTVPPLLGRLDEPTFLFVPLSRVVHASTDVLMRACAFTLHPHSNLSCIGDRPHACVGKSLPSFITCSQPNKHRSATIVLVPSMAHDLRHALHPRVRF